MGVFAMPSLGADMEDGVLVEWLAKPGDRVSRGDVIAVVETQKGAIEIEVFEDGVLQRLEAKVGERVPVGAPLALIGGEEAAPPTAQPETARPETQVEAAPAAAKSAPQAASQRPKPTGPMAAALAGAVLASPAARARAADLAIDLGRIRGTGPEGAILLTDVEAAAPAPTAAEKPSRRGLDLAEMRAAIAAAMARSKREIPHYYLSQTIDLQPATDWLAAQNETRPPERRLLMGALLVKASALALAAAPALNGRWQDDAFQASEAIHAGVAVALRGGGLIAPAIRDAEGRALDDLMAAMRDLVARTRAGRLRSSEMTDGTVTISSMGERGAETLTGVIYPPQVALIGFGTPGLRPWIVEGRVAPRTLIVATLAADHRVSDGRLGARFLAELDRLLQTPEAL
jgi:pyruvate dehydrogenase E2 component (dihydrolipoamide acetyltransferase)